eukprot:gene15838-11335_t
METAEQFLTTPGNIEFARDLPPAEIDEFCETLGVSRSASLSTISMAFKSRRVAMTFAKLNLLQQSMGQNLHQRTDKEDILYSVAEGGFHTALIPFALTRLAFLRSPQDFDGDAALEKVFQFFLLSDRTFSNPESANALITRALFQLTNAATAPEQRGLPEYYENSFSAYPFLPTVAPRLLENACCSYARKRLRNSPGDPPTYYSRYFAMVQSSGDTSIDSQVLAMLKESQDEAKVLGPDSSLPFENRLRSLATLIGARMFHTRPDDVDEAETAEWMELGGPPSAVPITGHKRDVEHSVEGPKRLRTDDLA